MEWGAMETFCQFLVRQHHLWCPYVLQQVHIHQAYGLDIGIGTNGGGKHSSVAAILSLQFDTVVHPGKL